MNNFYFKFINNWLKGDKNKNNNLENFQGEWNF